MPAILIFLMISYLTSAQVNRRDIVYLKNGSIIKGDILEVVPNETIKIKTSDGSIFVFKMEEVERTGKDEPVAKEISKEQADVTKTKERAKSSGYLFMVRLGPNTHLWEGSDFSAGIINAIQVNEYMSFGIGAEATTYGYDRDYNSSVVIYPFFFDARFYIPKERAQPMFSMQLGYSVVGNKKHRRDPVNGFSDFEPDSGNGGVFFGINAGVRIPVRNRLSVMIDGGISVQKLNGKRGYNESASVKEVPSIRGNLGICWNLGSNKK